MAASAILTAPSIRTAILRCEACKIDYKRQNACPLRRQAEASSTPAASSKIEQTSGKRNATFWHVEY
jgi:hypothetical protein